MSIFEIILLIVGSVLLVLALFSGVKLFQKASRDNADENSAGMGSLWLLFSVGIIGGLALIWFGLNGTGIAGWVMLGIVVIAGILGIMSLFG